MGSPFFMSKNGSLGDSWLSPRQARTRQGQGYILATCSKANTKG